MLRNVKRYAAVLLMVFALPMLTHAQTAQVNGKVKDSTGATVPQAKVSVRNTATNASREATTLDSGGFTITNLVPGLYDLKIEKEGLKTVQIAALTLAVDQAATVDVTMEVGPTSQTVTVTGESVAQINTSDAQVSTVVDERQIKSLPLIVRDPYQLILLTPGAVGSNSGLGGFSVNGGRERNNNFKLDGADNNDPGVPSGGVASLNPDVTEEFRIINSNYLPEFGRNSGAVIDIITKSGTNQLHGDVYEFGRWAATGTRDFFNHVPGTKKNAYTRNDFGASIGGPIVKDKTFFFFNYEGQRFATTLTNASTVPTAAFRTGIFTYSSPSRANRNIIITKNYDVSTATSPDNLAGLGLDPLIQNVLARFPLPNAGDVITGVTGTFDYASPEHVVSDAYTFKVDHNFTSKELLSVRYIGNPASDDNTGHSDTFPGIGGVSFAGLTQTLSGHLASTLSSTVLNDFRTSAVRASPLFLCTGRSTIDSLSPVLDPTGRGRDWNLPNLSTYACAGLGDSNQQTRPFGTFNAGDNVTWTFGRHTTKFGVEYASEYSNDANSFFTRSTPLFNNFTNSGVPAAKSTPTPTVGDQALQDSIWSLFGAVNQETQTQIFTPAGNRALADGRGERERDLYMFWQDAFKVLPNFTVDYGVRYEINGAPYEIHNLLTSATPAQLIGPAPITFIPITHGGSNPLYPTEHNGFEPRLGFAWDPFKTGKTAIRGGYGLFRDRIFFNLSGNIRGNPPLEQPFASFPFNPGAAVQSPSDLIANTPPPASVTPIATVGNFPTQDSLGFPGTIDNKFKVGYGQDWNFGVQRELGGNVNLEINYVGAKGDHLQRVVDGNPPNPANIAADRAFCQANPGICTDTPTASDVQGFRLYVPLAFGLPASFAAVQNSAFFHANLTKSIASSIYHGLQTTITRRFSHGLYIQGAYTYSHAIDDSGDVLAPQIHNVVFPTSSFDLRKERGNSEFDTRHRLVMNYTAELPFGRGKAHLSEGVAGKILEGWGLSGIFTLSRGTPFEVFTLVDSQGSGSTQRANFNPGASLVPLSGSKRTQTGPNPGLFSEPFFGGPGNLARNVFTGPGSNNWDMVLAKTTKITERFNLEFRTEVYNVFNRVQFGQWSNFIENGNFGQSTSQVGRNDATTGARQMQFALKLHF